MNKQILVVIILVFATVNCFSQRLDATKCFLQLETQPSSKTPDNIYFLAAKLNLKLVYKNGSVSKNLTITEAFVNGNSTGNDDLGTMAPDKKTYTCPRKLRPTNLELTLSAATIDNSGQKLIVFKKINLLCRDFELSMENEETITDLSLSPFYVPYLCNSSNLRGYLRARKRLYGQSLSINPQN